MEKSQWLTGQFTLVRQAGAEMQSVLQSNKKLKRAWQSLTVAERLALNNAISSALTNLLAKAAGKSDKPPGS